MQDLLKNSTEFHCYICRTAVCRSSILLSNYYCRYFITNCYVKVINQWHGTSVKDGHSRTLSLPTLFSSNPREELVQIISTYSKSLPCMNTRFESTNGFPSNLSQLSHLTWDLQMFRRLRTMAYRHISPLLVIPYSIKLYKTKSHS